MIKVEVVEEKDGKRIYVEASSAADQIDLDKLYEVVMSAGQKVGGYSSSLKFDVLLLNQR